MESNSTSSSSADVTRASLLIRLNLEGPAREVAWAEFYDLYAPVIAGFARRIGTRPQDVDDLVQEVLKAFFRVSPEFVYEYAVNAERQRTFRAFELSALLDRPTEQVASELGFSVEWVRAAKSRVSRAVREAFDGLDGITG